MKACGCRCIACGSSELDAREAGAPHADGERDIHHTCAACGAHLDHLEGDTFESCAECGHGRPQGGPALM